MLPKTRNMVDEHLVRKDSNGFSVEHALVADTSRSLIQELRDITNEQKIKREMRRRRDERKQKILKAKELVKENIDALASDQIDRKDDQKMINICQKRKLIDYADLDCFI